MSEKLRSTISTPIPEPGLGYERYKQIYDQIEAELHTAATQDPTIDTSPERIQALALITLRTEQQLEDREDIGNNYNSPANS